MKRIVTLVLGSGVAWGIAYAGVLKALEELEIEVRAVGGTSMAQRDRVIRLVDSAAH